MGCFDNRYRLLRLNRLRWLMVLVLVWWLMLLRRGLPYDSVLQSVSCGTEGSGPATLSKSQLTRALGHQWLTKGSQHDAHADHRRKRILLDFWDAVLAKDILVLSGRLGRKHDGLTLVEDSFAQLE